MFHCAPCGLRGWASGCSVHVCQATDIFATLLQDKLDKQINEIVNRLHGVFSQELDVGLEHLWDRLQHLHSFRPGSTCVSEKSESSTSSDAVQAGSAEDFASFAAPHCVLEPASNTQDDVVPGVREPVESQAAFGERPSSILEVPKLRRRSTICGAGRTAQVGAAEIRHSLLHSVAELDVPDGSHQTFRQSVLAMLASPASMQTDSCEVEHEHRTRFMNMRISLQRRIVETTWFEGFVVCCIGLNTIMIGAASDWNLKHINQEEPKHFRIAERLFAGIFALELLVRVAAYGPAFFWRMASWFNFRKI